MERKFRVMDLQTGEVKNKLDRDTAAAILNINPDELEWAVDEHGSADTDTHSASADDDD